MAIARVAAWHRNTRSPTRRHRRGSVGVPAPISDREDVGPAFQPDASDRRKSQAWNRDLIPRAWPQQDSPGKVSPLNT